MMDISEHTFSRSLVVLAGALALQAGAIGCAEQVEGESPEFSGEVAGDGDQAFADPPFTCNEQVEEWVKIQGESFAPIVDDSLEDPNVAYPTVELRRSGNLEGTFDSETSRATLEGGGENPRLRWIDDTELHVRLDGELELKPGVYNVVVTNPSSGESVTKEQAFGMLPRPTVEAVRPDLACIAQGKRSIDVEGGPFLIEDGSTPTVDVGGTDYEPVEMSECRELAKPFSGFEACSRITIEVDPDDFDPSAQDVTVHGIDEAACSSLPDEDGVKLRLEGPPEIESVEPLPLCSKQRDYEEFRIDGQGFMRVENKNGTRLPTVDLAGREFDVQRLEDCEQVQDIQNEDAFRCSVAYVRIDSGELDEIAQTTDTPISGHTDAGVGDTGTADTGSSDTSSSDTGSSDTSSSDTGTTDGGSTDTGAADTGTTDGGTTDTGTTDGGSTDAGDMDGGTTDGGTTEDPDGPVPAAEFTRLPLELTNPRPVGCTSTKEVSVPVVPPPMIHDATPDPVCNIDQSGEDGMKGQKTVTVTGAGFLVVDGTKPTVDIGENNYEVQDTDGCTDVEAEGRDVQSCTSVTVTITEDDLPVGRADIAVNNPEPANCTSEGSAPMQLTRAPTVMEATPSPICTTDRDRQVTVRGADFFVVEGERPEVTFAEETDGMEMDQTIKTYTADGAEGCHRVGVDGETKDVKRCSVLTVTVPQDELSAEEDAILEAFAVTVTNPGQTGCKSQDEVTYRTAGAPVVDTIKEDFACLEEGARSFTVSGANFMTIDDGMETREPMVEIDGRFYSPDDIRDCDDSNLDSDVEHCSTLDLTVPRRDLGPGDYDVRVHQPRPATCAGSDSVSLRVEPPPTVSDVTEQPLCAEQIDNVVTVHGSDFLVVDQTKPTVEINGKSYDGGDVTMTECADQPDADIDSRTVTRCSKLDVQTAKGDIPVGVQDVVVENPKASNPSETECKSREQERLRMVEAPSLDYVEPEPICTAQHSNSLTAVGGNFLIINPNGESRRLPEITFSGSQVTKTYTASNLAGCHPVPIPGDDPQVKRCDQLFITVDQGDLPADDYTVNVQNPNSAQCTSPSITYTVLPPPTLASIEPSNETPKKPLTCLDEEKKSFDLNGQDFLVNANGAQSPSGGDTPTAILNGVEYPTTVDDQDCTRMPGLRETRWLCTKLTFEVPQNAVTPGNYPVTVRNPRPAHCESNSKDLLVASSPFVSDINPSPICNADNVYTLEVDGRDFLEVSTAQDTFRPDVTLGGESVRTTRLRNCQGTSVSGVRKCGLIDIQVPTGTIGQPDQITEHEVVVTNPSPAACTSDERVVEKNVPPPQVNAATLQESCPNAGPDKLVVEGKYFMDIGGSTPDVTVNQQGNRATYQNVPLSGQCNTMTNVSQPTQYCNQSTFDLGKQSGLSGGQWTIGVDNPRTAQCSVQRQIQVDAVPPAVPEVDNVQPPRTCATGGKLQINGDNFKKGVKVRLGGVPANNINRIDEEEIVASWNQQLPEGEQILEVVNPDGCRTEYTSEKIEVLTGPLAIFVDPPVHYNELKVEALAYFTEGNAQDVSKVRIRGPKGVVRELNFDTISGQDDQLSITLPAEDPKNPGSPLPAGKYDVQITESIAGVDCGEWVDELLTVVDNQQLAVKDIEPEYGWKDEPTGVTITARDNPSAGQTQFQSTPRVYANPRNSQGASAREVRGVTFNDPTELNGIVPEDTQDTPMPTGRYDIIVINPDNSVGVLSDAFEITDRPVPKIDNVSPGTWPTSRNITVQIQGSDFRLNSNQNNPVSLECRDGSPPNSLSVIHSQTDASTVTLDVDTDGMTEGDICEITVENPNGSVAKYSPVATVNPAYNFISFTDVATMKQGRRWPVMSSGVPSRQQRFIYAFGGDNGSPGSVRSSGEFAQLDRFGDVDEWHFQPYDLPGQGRTLARGTRIRDFIYLVGGHDGNGPTNSILRANVLDPVHTPDIDDLEFSFEEAGGGGLSPGVYYYRVSAVHDSNADHNPDGETLTTDVQPVFVPDLGGRFNVKVKISWTSFTNVDKYRLYRSPNPDMTVGEEKLLAETPAGTTSYLDDGSDTTSSDSPIPVGATGKWHQVGTLGTPRMKHGLRGLVDPETPNKAYIYAVGGETVGGTETDTIEKIVINDPDTSVKRDQSVGTVTLTGATTTDPVTDLQAMVATEQNANNLTSNTAHLYALGGETPPGPGGGGAQKTVDIWEIQTGVGNGALTNNRSGRAALRSRAGHGATIANNYIVSFGGHNASPNDTGDNSNPLTSDGDVTGWNSLGDVDMEPRYRMGRTSLVGFFYLGGGTGSNGTLDTVEYSVVGTTRQ